MTSQTALPPHPFLMPERALPAKTRLDEFEIEAVLAQSSFGIVYRAYDHVLKLHVAVKESFPDTLALRSADTQVVLRASSHSDLFEQGLQAFAAEAQALARCEHPSLQRVSRLLLRHGTAYRVMRYCRGPTLLEHRRELGTMPDAALMRGWLDGLLGALEALHEEGVVHGAVEPGNILLATADRPVLLDFDAVRSALISDRTQSMMAVLEPCYQPIEHRAPTPDSSPGPWTDLYALAATLHFCISGQLPPPMSDVKGERFEALGAVWQQLRQAQPEIGAAPSWLSALDACLREEPEARPQSVAVLRELLGVPVASSTSPVRAAAPPPVVPGPVPEVGPSATPVPSLPNAPPMVSPAVTSSKATSPAAPLEAAPRPAPPPDTANAEGLADLDKTFAFIAERATEEAQPKVAARVGPAVRGAREPGPTLSAPEPSTGPKPLVRRQWALAGVAALVMLPGLAALAIWLHNEVEPPPTGAAPLAALPLPALPSPVVPATPAAPVESATTKELEAIEAAPNNALRFEAPPKPSTPAPAAVKPKGPATPREACGGSTRFALYRCMQTQCAKRAWTKHPQCVQFRKDQKL